MTSSILPCPYPKPYCMRPPLSVMVTGGAACHSMMTISLRYFQKLCQIIRTSLKDEGANCGSNLAAGYQRGVRGRINIPSSFRKSAEKTALGRIPPGREALQGVHLLGVADFRFRHRFTEKFDRVVVGPSHRHLHGD